MWYVHLTQSNHLTATHCAADEILIAIDRRAIQSSLSLWMNEWMPVTAVDRFLIVGCRIHTDVVVLRTRPFSFCFHYVQLQLVNKFDILVRATRLFTSATVADVSAFDTMSTASEVTTYGGQKYVYYYPPFASIAKGDVFDLLYVCLFVCSSTISRQPAGRFTPYFACGRSLG